MKTELISLLSALNSFTPKYFDHHPFIVEIPFHERLPYSIDLPEHNTFQGECVLVYTT